MSRDSGVFHRARDFKDKKKFSEEWQGGHSRMYQSGNTWPRFVKRLVSEGAVCRDAIEFKELRGM